MALSGLTLVVQTRALDRIHYALMLAVSAAALAELEARFAACDTGLAVAGLSAEDLRVDVPIETTGLADVLASAESGRIVYV
ncbi:MAG: hypothetical protein RIM80_05450 [Alphaproteobacteria bacterium]